MMKLAQNLLWMKWPWLQKLAVAQQVEVLYCSPHPPLACNIEDVLITDLIQGKIFLHPTFLLVLYISTNLNF